MRGDTAHAKHGTLIAQAGRPAQTRWRAATVLFSAGLVLTACSSTSNPGNSLPTYTPGTTAAPTTTRSGPVPPTPLGYLPADPQKIGAWLVFKAALTGTPQEEAVLQ